MNLDAARALFQRGLAAFEAGRYTDAADLFEAALVQAPGRASVLVNLGATRLKLGQPAAALSSLAAALTTSPDDAQAWAHRGDAEAALGRHADAITSFGHGLDRAVAQQTQKLAAAAVYKRALAHGHLGRHDEARADAQRAVDLDPTASAGWALLGSVLKDGGQLDEARACLRRALALGADDDITAYLAASLDPTRPAPPTAPRRYVQGLFDGYAAQFEQHLRQGLDYRAPEQIVQLLAGRRFEAALDLGCGTGVLGELLAPQVGWIDGVDLSAAMLAIARQRGAYRTLAQQDLVEHLDERAARGELLDLVVAADVFIYVGALESTFAAVRRVLRPTGLFAFSAERLDGEAGPGYALQPSSRYAHSSAYLGSLAEVQGFRIERSQAVVLRVEQRRPVQGWVMGLVRAG